LRFLAHDITGTKITEGSQSRCSFAGIVRISLAQQLPIPFYLFQSIFDVLYDRHFPANGDPLPLTIEPFFPPNSRAIDFLLELVHLSTCLFKAKNMVLSIPLNGADPIDTLNGCRTI
jgi:hypothetical protein